MSQVIPDLWPNQLGAATERTPVEILREQARFLGQRTKQVIQAEVVLAEGSIGIWKNPLPEPNGIVYKFAFRLVAPALNDYRFVLFWVRYPLKLFPVQILWKDEQLEASSESELIAALRRILSSEETAKIINSLLAHSIEAGS